MKRILVIAGVGLLLVSSCTTRKKVQRDLNEFYATKPTAPTEVVVEEPVQKPAPAPAPTKVTPPEPEKVVTTVTSAPIVVREEKVVIAQGEDMRKDAFKYFVILGSFSQKDNALRYKQDLIKKGFLPTLLENQETGFFRVSVYNSNSEQEARGLIADIRDKYPEHKDVWLLKKM